MNDKTAKFMYLFNQSLPERERLFKLSRATYYETENKVTVYLLMAAADYDAKLDQALKDKVAGIIREIVPASFETDVKFIKTDTSESYIRSLILQYLYDNSPMLYPRVNADKISVTIDYGKVKANLQVASDVYAHMLNNGYGAILASYIEAAVMEDAEVEFSIDNDPVSLAFRRRPPNPMIQTGVRTAIINKVESVIGSAAKMPIYIADALGKESPARTVCGKVLNLFEKTAKEKGTKFFVWNLDDTSGVMPCQYFPRSEESRQKFAAKVKDGSEIVVEGPVRSNRFATGGYALTANRISTCEIDYTSINTREVYWDVAEEYYTVFPEPYKSEEQSAFFDEVAAAELPEGLKGNYVVFDIETTGLETSSDKIIEIGAVKMVDGVLTETFATLINPERPIPVEATKVNNIKNEDVARAPKFEEVVSDFYKFCHGSTLVAHNASFDIGVVSASAKALSYKFDHPRVDTLALAKTLVRSGNYKLQTLLEKFGIINKDAHRALHDAEATAKLYKALCKIKDKSGK